jgi:hypothetical protein
MESNEAELKALGINYVAKSWRIDTNFVAFVVRRLPVFLFFFIDFPAFHYKSFIRIFQDDFFFPYHVNSRV